MFHTIHLTNWMGVSLKTIQIIMDCLQMSGKINLKNNFNLIHFYKCSLLCRFNLVDDDEDIVIFIKIKMRPMEWAPELKEIAIRSKLVVSKEEILNYILPAIDYNVPGLIIKNPEVEDNKILCDC